jgi:hypothetical protein
MRREDVPQEGSLTAGCREITYAVDHAGRYLLEPSLGWEAKSIALSQAWEHIVGQLRDVIREIKAGEKSALAYHMVNEQMDLALLSQYSGIALWRVKRHLKPAVFTKLTTADLSPYTELFGITVDELRAVPDEPPPPPAAYTPSEGPHS